MNVTIPEEVLDTIDVSSDYISIEADVELAGTVDIDIFADELVVDVGVLDGISTEISVDVGQIIYSGNDYTVLENKPKINGVTLIGDKSFPDLDANPIPFMDLLRMFT